MQALNRFAFKGVQSDSMGVSVLEYPDIVLPAERAAYLAVKGRAGSLKIDEGEDAYEDIVLCVKCMVEDEENLSAIAAWLRGSGRLTVGKSPAWFYLANVEGQVALRRFARGAQARIFEVRFRCAPYRYVYPEAENILLTQPGVVNNLGAAPAAPLIHVKGSGDVTLTMGQGAVLIDDLKGDIFLDFEEKVAYDDSNVLLTGLVTLADNVWPTLPPGNVLIGWSGSVTSVEIVPRWRNR